jgi:hypothetical protein
MFPWLAIVTPFKFKVFLTLTFHVDPSTLSYDHHPDSYACTTSHLEKKYKFNGEQCGNFQFAPDEVAEGLVETINCKPGHCTKSICTHLDRMVFAIYY